MLNIDIMVFNHLIMCSDNTEFIPTNHKGPFQGHQYLQELFKIVGINVTTVCLVHHADCVMSARNSQFKSFS